MKLIRPKTFETNSSSTHAITIPKKIDKSLLGVRPNIYFRIGEFAWEYETYELKDYIWTAICSIYPNEYEEYKQKIIDILNPYYKEIQFEEPIFIEGYDDNENTEWKYLDNGCIDHSEELVSFLKQIFKNEKLLINATLEGYVKTGNDNDEGYALDDLTDNPNYYHYYKGN